MNTLPQSGSSYPFYDEDTPIFRIRFRGKGVGLGGCLDELRGPVVWFLYAMRDTCGVEPVQRDLECARTGAHGLGLAPASFYEADQVGMVNRPRAKGRVRRAGSIF